MRVAVRCAVTGLLAVCVVRGAAARDLSFDERVRAEAALQHYTYANQTGSTQPFEQAVSRADLERSVATTLEQSAALEKTFGTPITAEMLRRELERMAGETRMASRLQDLYALLGNDPFVIQECLVRPALADRLIRAAFASDPAIQADPMSQAAALRRDLSRFGVEHFAADPRRSVVEISTSAADLRRDPASRSVGLSPESYARWRAAAPARAGQIGDIRSELDAFVISVVLEDHGNSARIVNFTIPKKSFDDWWVIQRVAVDPDAVAAVADGNGLPTPVSGARAFDPERDWNDGSLDESSHPRAFSAGVWTGSRVVAWGGYSDGVALSGGRYDPATDTWQSMSRFDAPARAEQLDAGWDGTEVAFKTGGRGGAIVGRYDPMTDTWRPGEVAPAAGVGVQDSGSRATPPAVTDSMNSVGTQSGGSLGISSGRLPEQPISNDDSLAPTVAPNGTYFPVTTPVVTQIFLGTEGGYFGYCVGGPSAGLTCTSDATCPGGVCEQTLDNTFCVSYNMSCSGVRTNGKEYGFNDVLETTYDSSPAPGRQTWIERNWNYISSSGTFWRPFHFALEVDANSTCVGGTNPGGYCTLGDLAGVCTGGGTCTGAVPTGGARWTFIPNNRNGNTALHLSWPFAAFNLRMGTDEYWYNGFSSWMRSSDINPGGTTSGGKFATYLDHTNDRRGYGLNGLYSIIDFNATTSTAKSGIVTAGYFDARISGSTPNREITSLTGLRSDINLIPDTGPEPVGPSYGLFVQFNPTGNGVTSSGHTGIYVATPGAPGTGTTIVQQDGLVIADQQLGRSGGTGAAIRISSQTTSDGTEGNLTLEGGNWNTGHVQLAQAHLWRDASGGRLRYRNDAAPAAENDGTAVVTGTSSISHGVVLWGVTTLVDPNFDTGNKVCSSSGLTCVETSDLGNFATIPCGQPHTASAKWIAFCK